MCDRRWWKSLAGVLCVSLAFLSCSKVPDVPSISKEELRSLLDAPEVIVLDVIREEDWKLTERKIKGAERRPPKEVGSWVDAYSKDQFLILYCS